MYQPNLKSITLSVPEIIAIEVLGGVANPQSWERGGRRDSGMHGTARKNVGEFL